MLQRSPHWHLRRSFACGNDVRFPGCRLNILLLRSLCARKVSNVGVLCRLARAMTYTWHWLVGTYAVAEHSIGATEATFSRQCHQKVFFIFAASAHDNPRATPKRNKDSLTVCIKNLWMSHSSRVVACVELGTVLLKREDLQEVFSFKIRGAYNKICSLSTDAKKVRYSM